MGTQGQTGWMHRMEMLACHDQRNLALGTPPLQHSVARHGVAPAGRGAVRHGKGVALHCTAHHCAGAMETLSSGLRPLPRTASCRGDQFFKGI